MNDDAISRQAVLILLYALPPEEATTKAMLIQNVKQMDAAPEKRGKWEPYRCDMYICSECGHVYTELSSMEKCEANYCPNCGADMRGEQE